MDETDLAILREVYPDQVWRHGEFDPRISAAQIARRLGMSRGSARDRILAWRRSGFFANLSVFPNPRTLGRSFYGQALESRSPKARARVIQFAQTLPGLVHIWETGEGNLWLCYIGRTAGAARRGAAVFEQIPGIGVRKPYAYLHPTPACKVPLRRRDWEMIRALRAAPFDNLHEVAARLGVSYRTTRRRFERLMANHSILYVPQLDHTRTTGAFALVEVLLRDPSAAQENWSLVQRLRPVMLPLDFKGSVNRIWDQRLAATPEYFLMFFTVLGSPAQSDRFVQELEAHAAVQSVVVDYPARLWEFRGTMDSLIEAELVGGPPRAVAGRS